MECEESFITMKLIWHSYLVLSLGNCAYETPTETGLSHHWGKFMDLLMILLFPTRLPLVKTQVFGFCMDKNLKSTESPVSHASKLMLRRAWSPKTASLNMLAWVSLLPPDCLQGSPLHLPVVLQEIVKSPSRFPRKPGSFSVSKKTSKQVQKTKLLSSKSCSHAKPFCYY